MATVQKVSTGIIVNLKAPIELKVSSDKGPFNKKLYHKDSTLTKYIHELSTDEREKIEEIYKNLNLLLGKLWDKNLLQENASATAWAPKEIPDLHDIVSPKLNSPDVVFLPIKKDLVEQLKKPTIIRVDAVIKFTGLTIKDSFGGVFSVATQREMMSKLGNTYKAYPNFQVEYTLTEAEATEVEL